MGRNGMTSSWVIAENRKPGTRSWAISGSGTPISGYANAISAQAGQRVTLYVSTAAPQFQVTAYRMGYYGGTGARTIWHSSSVPGSQQPQCPLAQGINMVECHWRASLSFVVGDAWVQGDYLLKLTSSGGGASYVPLTVWDPHSKSTYVVMNAVLTWQAWNTYGGYDMYGGGAPGQTPQYDARARVLSFDRPYAYGAGAGDFLGNELPLVEFVEQYGLDVTYWTDITLAEHPQLLLAHKTLLSLGHDEQWSAAMRTGATQARDHGVNLIFFGASPVLRKVRLESSPLGADRREVNYRDATADPLYGKNNAEVSQNQWSEPPASLPSSELVGASYGGYGIDSDMIVTQPQSWLFTGTGLHTGSALSRLIRYDYDFYDTSSPHPANVQVLTHSPVGGGNYADTTYYTTLQSKAGVFETGTNYWVASMSPCDPHAAGCPNDLIRQITGNLFRVFGAGPAGETHPS